jgi:hypothetical protein
MAKRAIGGKIIVSEGVTTVDLRVGAQTVRLTIEEARELARTPASAAMALHDNQAAAHHSRISRRVCVNCFMRSLHRNVRGSTWSALERSSPNCA